MAALEPPRRRIDARVRRPRLHRRYRFRPDGPLEVDGGREPGGRSSSVWDELPLLPGVLEAAAQGILSGAVERNRESSADSLAAVDGVYAAGIDILFDAQTSGGLLVAVPESAAAGFVKRLHAEGIAEAAVIGRALAEGEGRTSGPGHRPPPDAPRATVPQRTASRLLPLARWRKPTKPNLRGRRSI